MPQEEYKKKNQRLTENVSPNPHDSHDNEIGCALCHKVHKDSILYRNACRSFNFKVP
jgi:hypothetical protein